MISNVGSSSSVVTSRLWITSGSRSPQRQDQIIVGLPHQLQVRHGRRVVGERAAESISPSFEALLSVF